MKQKPWNEKNWMRKKKLKVVSSFYLSLINCVWAKQCITVPLHESEVKIPGKMKKNIKLKKLMLLQPLHKFELADNLPDFSVNRTWEK